VACSNLANLSLARGLGRQQEMAVRLALGAPRWRVARELLTESVLLATMGGVLALGVAKALTVLMSQGVAVSGAVGVLQIEPRLDIHVLLVAAGATLLALIVAGLTPALQAAGTDVHAGLAAETSHSATPGWRGRRPLVAAQVAASVVLLALAALAALQLRRIQQEDYGFALGDLAVAEINFHAQGHDRARIERVVAAFLAKMSSSRDASGVAVATGLPRGPSYLRGAVTSPDTTRPVPADVIAGSTGMLATFGIRVLSGRVWDASDLGHSQVAVVDEWTARTMFGPGPAVGRTIDLQVGNDPVRLRTIAGVVVVGVVADTARTERFRRRAATVYLPFNHDFGPRLVFVARAAGDPEPLVGLVQKALRDIDPELVARVGAAPEIVGSNALFFRITAGTAALLGGFAWALAIAGLFGVLSQLVLRRTREIGIRVALGATPGDVTRMIVKEGLSPVVLGAVAGLGLSIAFRISVAVRFLSLPPAVDFLALAMAPLPFLGAAVLACYVPARRAASVSPNLTLRRN
jgi:predicted permease